MNTILATIFYLANLLGLVPSASAPAVSASVTSHVSLYPESSVGNGTRTN